MSVGTRGSALWGQVCLLEKHFPAQGAGAVFARIDALSSLPTCEKLLMPEEWAGPLSTSGRSGIGDAASGPGATAADWEAPRRGSPGLGYGCRSGSAPWIWIWTGRGRAGSSLLCSGAGEQSTLTLTQADIAVPHLSSPEAGSLCWARWETVWTSLSCDLFDLSPGRLSRRRLAHQS